MTLVKFSPLENLFCYLFAWPLRGCGVAKVNSPSQIKGISSSANPNGDKKKSFLIHWESFPALPPRVPASGVAALRLCLDSVEAQVYLPAPWQREGKAQKAPPPLCSSLDQVSLITSGRGRIAPVTAWDGQTLKSSHSQLHIIWHTEPQSYMPECHWWSLFVTGLMIFSSKSANKRWLGMAYFYCELKRSLILSLLKFLCVSLTTEEQNPKWVGNFLLKHSL